MQELIKLDLSMVFISFFSYVYNYSLNPVNRPLNQPVVFRLSLKAEEPSVRGVVPEP